MAKVRFQNGAEASTDILLSEEIDDGASGSDKKARLKELAHIYGTVADAVAWIDGDDKPKSLEAVPAEIPATSVLVERVPQAPPSPDVEAKEAARLARAEAENEAAREEAKAAHVEALAKEAAEADEAKAAEAEAKKK